MRTTVFQRAPLRLGLQDALAFVQPFETAVEEPGLGVLQVEEPPGILEGFVVVKRPTGEDVDINVAFLGKVWILIWLSAIMTKPETPESSGLGASYTRTRGSVIRVISRASG